MLLKSNAQIAIRGARPGLRHAFSRAAEFSLAATVVGLLRVVPRDVARLLGAAVGMLAYRLFGRQRRVGDQNLQIAFPEMPAESRSQLLQDSFRHLGHLLAEFCQMSKYTQESASRFIRYQGLENYLQARDRGRGVLVLTGHLGAWELSSFFHSLMGMPMGIVVRRLDNSRLDAMVNRIRSLHGNQVIDKGDFARGLIHAMRAGGTVGILMDTNMTPPQGVFVPFFGRLACTASGLARVARKTGAAVVPGFLLWEPGERRYVLHFGPEIPLSRGSNPEADVLEDTARFTAVVEDYIRHYPEQWLWMHRRWKTRPPGEPPIYS